MRRSPSRGLTVYSLYLLPALRELTLGGMTRLSWPKWPRYMQRWFTSPHAVDQPVPELTRHEVEQLRSSRHHHHGNEMLYFTALQDITGICDYLGIVGPSLRFNGHFAGGPGLAIYQNVSILDYIGAKEDDGRGGDNWSYKTCKTQSNCHHQQTNTQLFTGLPVAQPTVSEHWRKNSWSIRIRRIFRYDPKYAHISVISFCMVQHYEFSLGDNCQGEVEMGNCSECADSVSSAAESDTAAVWLWSAGTDRPVARWVGRRRVQSWEISIVWWRVDVAADSSRRISTHRRARIHASASHIAADARYVGGPVRPGRARHRGGVAQLKMTQR